MNTLATAGRPPRGFTLIELLIVISIMALASAGVSMALRDNSQTQLEREAQRLAALLDTARARSRASGVAVQWVSTPQGFTFTGLPEGSMPQQWLSPGTQALPTPLRLNLGDHPKLVLGGGGCGGRWRGLVAAAQEAGRLRTGPGVDLGGLAGSHQRLLGEGLEFGVRTALGIGRDHGEALLLCLPLCGDIGPVEVGPLQRREIAQQVGMFLLVSLMVFALYNDVHRLLVG